MKRLLLILVAVSALAQPRQCDSEMVARWNRFAGDANEYVHGLAGGVVNAKVRARLDREWKAVTRCECW